MKRLKSQLLADSHGGSHSELHFAPRQNDEGSMTPHGGYLALLRSWETCDVLGSIHHEESWIWSPKCQQGQCGRLYQTFAQCTSSTTPHGGNFQNVYEKYTALISLRHRPLQCHVDSSKCRLTFIFGIERTESEQTMTIHWNQPHSSSTWKVYPGVEHAVDTCVSNPLLNWLQYPGHRPS
jgi:hypothetical protein